MLISFKKRRLAADAVPLLPLTRLMARHPCQVQTILCLFPVDTRPFHALFGRHGAPGRPA